MYLSLGRLDILGILFRCPAFRVSASSLTIVSSDSSGRLRSSCSTMNTSSRLSSNPASQLAATLSSLLSRNIRRTTFKGENAWPGSAVIALFSRISSSTGRVTWVPTDFKPASTVDNSLWLHLMAKQKSVILKPK